jgi:hypothetical protein
MSPRRRALRPVNAKVLGGGLGADVGGVMLGAGAGVVVGGVVGGGAVVGGVVGGGAVVVVVVVVGGVASVSVQVTGRTARSADVMVISLLRPVTVKVHVVDAPGARPLFRPCVGSRPKSVSVAGPKENVVLPVVQTTATSTFPHRSGGVTPGVNDWFTQAVCDIVRLDAARVPALRSSTVVVFTWPGEMNVGPGLPSWPNRLT